MREECKDNEIKKKGMKETDAKKGEEDMPVLSNVEPSVCSFFQTLGMFRVCVDMGCVIKKVLWDCYGRLILRKI